MIRGILISIVGISKVLVAQYCCLVQYGQVVNNLFGKRDQHHYPYFIKKSGCAVLAILYWSYLKKMKFNIIKCVGSSCTQTDCHMDGWTHVASILAH